MQETIWRCRVVQHGAAFRLDALKFSSGILNSYGAVPIAPQRYASRWKTGEMALKANLRGENAVVNGSLTEILSALAAGAYNKVVNDAKQANANALVSTLATAKTAFVTDPSTSPTEIRQFNCSFAVSCG